MCSFRRKDLISFGKSSGSALCQFRSEAPWNERLVVRRQNPWYMQPQTRQSTQGRLLMYGAESCNTTCRRPEIGKKGVPGLLFTLLRPQIVTLHSAHNCNRERRQKLAYTIETASPAKNVKLSREDFWTVFPWAAHFVCSRVSRSRHVRVSLVLSRRYRASLWEFYESYCATSHDYRGTSNDYRGTSTSKP